MADQYARFETIYYLLHSEATGITICAIAVW